MSKQATLSSHTQKYTAAAWIRTIIMLILSLIIIIPLVMVFLGSVKSPAEAAQMNLQLPTSWNFSNYAEVFVKGNMLRGFINSTIITLFSVITILIMASMATYIIARRNVWWTNLLYFLCVVGLIAPPSMIPTIKVMRSLHIYGEYYGLVLYYTALLIPFAIFIMTGFMKGVPRELDEAATVDGAGASRTFFTIVLPLLQPSLATTAVFLFMFVWNDFYIPMFLINDSSMYTIPFSIFYFVSQYGSQWHYIFADLIMAALPVLLLYVFLQRYIIEGMTAGSVKG
ncbi:carbohydrate ABC transporter permease [Paenibacillus yanchengensis]|uniref:Carbohydrate ABC transporter permease n=1 Tax=Paenibacillus yanchengensis TaxID=2035833 RepID=A0ABW4YIZ5_9BACL